jgi:molecular chaperone DnaK (HSP70)
MSRYVVGIDLGTTNNALAFVDTQAGDEAEVQTLKVPQIVQPGTVAERSLLPSFLYLPGPKEQPAGSMDLPWAAGRDFAAGEFARNFGSQVPTRLVASAKSWLCHGGVDRNAPLLPWKAPDNSRKVSPVQASTMYLAHLRDSWNYVIAGGSDADRLEHQDIILTVPASFDAVARELTVAAAREAGLENITLLEEPQAAFYAWIDALQEKWRRRVEVGDVVLVCDVGGGTTDLTLIAVSQEKGQLVLTRIAVGDHILLGGDNMDLALAHTVAQNLAAKGTKLDAGQMQMLWHNCRHAKEKLFTDLNAQSTPITVLGRGSKVIGGTIQTELTRADLERVLIDGFFPDCPANAEPSRQRAVGLQELGLPYAPDVALSRHLASFLHRNGELMVQKRAAPRKGKAKAAPEPVPLPTAILFNGGVFKAPPLRARMLELVNRWAKAAGANPIKELEGGDLDLAVANGAAYYALVRRGKGVRIMGGTARSYYIGVASSLPAVPGAPPPIKALCVVPFGMEEGTETDVPGQEFGLVVGEPAEFRFLGSSARRNDPVGTVVEEWEGDITELDPMQTTLEASEVRGPTVPVHLHSKVTEIGTLELWCISRDSPKQRWKLEFNVRERPE